MARLGRLELPTYRFEVCCSIHLSYRREPNLRIMNLIPTVLTKQGRKRGPQTRSVGLATRILGTLF